MTKGSRLWLPFFLRCETAGSLLLLAHVTDSPDRIRAVVGDEQRTIAAYGNTDRPSPDIAVVGCEAGQKVLIFSCGFSLLEWHADHFIARALTPVPGAVFGGEDIPVIFAGELVALVENHFQRRKMRLKKDVGGYYFVPKFGVLAFVLRIIVAAHVVPGPAIEAAIFKVGNVIGHQVIAECVAFIHRSPQLTGFRLNG